MYTTHSIVGATTSVGGRNDDCVGTSLVVVGQDLLVDERLVRILPLRKVLEQSVGDIGPSECPPTRRRRGDKWNSTIIGGSVILEERKAEIEPLPVVDEATPIASHVGRNVSTSSGLIETGLVPEGFVVGSSVYSLGSDKVEKVRAELFKDGAS